MAIVTEHVWLEIDNDNIIIAVHNQQPNTVVITRETGHIILETDVENPTTLIGLNIEHLNTPLVDRPERVVIPICKQLFLKARSLKLDLLTLEALGANNTQEYADKLADLNKAILDYGAEDCIVTL